MLGHSHGEPYKNEFAGLMKKKSAVIRRIPLYFAWQVFTKSFQNTQERASNDHSRERGDEASQIWTDTVCPNIDGHRIPFV